MRKGILISQAIICLAIVLFACSNNSQSTIDCTFSDVNLSDQINGSVDTDADSIFFDLKDYVMFDSLFVYSPYSSIPAIENRFHCVFESTIPEDDIWCLLIFARYPNIYTYSLVNRFYDFTGLEGEYSIKDVGEIRGVQTENRYVLSFK